MKKFLFLFLMFCIQMNLNGFDAKKDVKASEIKLIEFTLLVPFADLIINQNGISVNYEGHLLAVNSLEKNGELWIVRAGGYCPNNHRIVCRCGGCAVSSCGYCCSCYSDNKKSL